MGTNFVRFPGVVLVTSGVFFAVCDGDRCLVDLSGSGEVALALLFFWGVCSLFSSLGNGFSFVDGFRLGT